MTANHLYYQLRRAKARNKILRNRLLLSEHRQKEGVTYEQIIDIKTHIYRNTVLQVGCYFSGIIFIFLFNKITKC